MKIKASQNWSQGICAERECKFMETKRENSAADDVQYLKEHKEDKDDNKTVKGDHSWDFQSRLKTGE
jgi:hypothetical protein